MELQINIFKLMVVEKIFQESNSQFDTRNEELFLTLPLPLSQSSKVAHEQSISLSSVIFSLIILL